MTIKDIASLAGVSPSTVSKVLNNKADSIAEETREMVLRIVKEYNYQPFHRFIQSDSAFSGLVGLLLPGESNEYGDFITGAQAAATAEGYSMILSICPSERERSKQLSNLFSRGVDGIAMYLDGPADLSAMFADAPEKLVYTAASNRQDVAGECVAHCDFAAATRLAAEHLIGAGHREIALIGWGDHSLKDDLVTGYSEALYAHEITKQANSICLCQDAGQITAFVQQFTYGSGSAFLCQDVQIAAIVHRVLNRYGLQVPRDYSVITLSAQKSPLDTVDPVITAVDIRHEELGRLAMETLIAKIECQNKTASRIQTLSPRLREGASVTPPLRSTGNRIVVVGSMNMDVIIHTTHLPTSGESLQAQRLLNLPGGKGANQSVGVAKLNGNVYAIGCLGSDQEGRLLYNSLVENGVNTAGVRIIHEKPTGKAYIWVAENGESTIVRAHGANDELLPGVIQANSSCFDGAKFCLISTEMPWETVQCTIDLCAAQGIQTIVKPTTQKAIPLEILKKITFLVPNEKELAVQIGGTMSIEEKAACLYEAGAEHVIVTLGEKGCYLHDGQMRRHFPAGDFQAVDTTGAGDAFISALAVYLSEGQDIVSSIKFATYAAGLSITRDGVQPALADRMALHIYAEKFTPT